MPIRWTKSLTLVLGLLVMQAGAAPSSCVGQEAGWRVPPQGTTQPQASNPRDVRSPGTPSATLGQPVCSGPSTADNPPGPGSGATLGKPVLRQPAPTSAREVLVDGQLRPSAFKSSWDNNPIVQTRSDEDDEPQPIITPPARTGPIQPLFGEELAPPPRADAPVPAPPRVAEFFPFPQAAPRPDGPPPVPFPPGGPPPVPFPPGGPPPVAFHPGGPPPAPVLTDGGPLCAPAPYPGNELYVRAEALLWWTKGAPVPALGTSFAGPTIPNGLLGTPGTSVALGDQSFGAGVRGGGRLMVGYWFDDDHLFGVEGGFFVLGQSTQTQSASSQGAAGLAIPYFNTTTGPSAFPIAGTNQVGTLGLAYKSDLWGTEANLRGVLCQCPCSYIDFVIGYRGLGLDESLNFTGTTATTNGTTLPNGATFFSFRDRFSTQNRFNGGQIGTVMEWKCGCWVFDLTAKVAMGVTNEVVTNSGSSVAIAGGATTISSNSGFFAQPNNVGRFTQNNFAVVPEVGMTVGYQITPRLRTFVGYNFLYWSRVVRPTDQLNTMVNGALPGNVIPPFSFHPTDFRAQGVTLGLEWRF